MKWYLDVIKIKGSGNQKGVNQFYINGLNTPFMVSGPLNYTRLYRIVRILHVIIIKNKYIIYHCLF